MRGLARSILTVSALAIAVGCQLPFRDGGDDRFGEYRSAAVGENEFVGPQIEDIVFHLWNDERGGTDRTLFVRTAILVDACPDRRILYVADRREGFIAVSIAGLASTGEACFPEQIHRTDFFSVPIDLPDGRTEIRFVRGDRSHSFLVDVESDVARVAASDGWGADTTRWVAPDATEFDLADPRMPLFETYGPF